MSSKIPKFLGTAPGGKTGEKSFPVLLAEDNEDDLWLWHEALKRAGVTEGPTVVRDGVEAIAYLAGSGIYADRVRYPFPRLMLLDLSMPRIDGFAVLEWWKNAARPEPLTIIVLTASELSDHIERANKLGATSYLLKPANLEEVTDLAGIALAFCRQSDAEASGPAAAAPL